MKKQITITILGIFLLTSVMAMFAGDTMSFQTNFTNPYYTVVGNSSSLEGLIVTFDNGNITISPVLNYKPDNFTLILFDNLTNEVIKEVRVGGGSRTTTITKNITTYVPTYLNNTIEIPVEKIVLKPIDNTTILEKEIPTKTIIIILLIGIMVGAWSYHYWRKNNDTKPIKEDLYIKAEDMR